MDFNARVSNKIDSLENWENNNPVLLEGEIIIINSPDGQKIKIGNGTNNFKDLPLYNIDILNKFKQIDWSESSEDSVNFIKNKPSSLPNPKKLIFSGTNQEYDGSSEVTINLSSSSQSKGPLSIDFMSGDKWTDSDDKITQEIACDAITTTSIVIVGPDPNDLENWNKYNARCISLQNGGFTIQVDKIPTDQIYIHGRILIFDPVEDENLQTYIKTLSKDGWIQNQQNINIDNLSIDKNIIISPTPEYLNNWSKFNLICTEQNSEGLIIKCNSTPNIDIDINIMIF